MCVLGDYNLPVLHLGYFEAIFLPINHVTSVDDDKSR